jgi:hypothetical protein
MPPFHRPFLSAALRGILVAASAACCVALALWQGADSPAVPGSAGDADAHAQPNVEAVDVCRKAMQRAVEKQGLAAEVVEGRLSLVGAAARYRDLNAGEPAFNWQALRTTYPGCPDDELHCREVLSFVRIELQHRPEADPALAEHLEAELHDLLGRGNFRLPGPTSPAAAP